MSDHFSDGKPLSPLHESLSALVDGEVSELELHRLLGESEQDPEVRARWNRYQMASSVLRQDYRLDQYQDISTSVRDAISGIEPDKKASTADTVASIVNHDKSTKSGTQSTPSRWWAAASKFAVAASVAGVVLVGAQQANLVAFSNPGFDAGIPNETVADAANSGATGPGSLAAYSAVGDVPQIWNTSEAVNLPLTVPENATPVPMQAVSDENNFFYQERRQPQVRMHVMDSQLAEYNQIINNYFNELILEHAEHAASNGSSSLLPFARVPEDVEPK